MDKNTHMTRIIINSLFVLCTELCVTLYADVAPPVFPGYTLSPFEAKSVRMKSEKVDIYYGDICKVEAFFEILNPTKEIAERKIGFPLNISANSGVPHWWHQGTDTVNKIYDFMMSLNDSNMAATDVPAGREIQSDKQYWYGWTCRFKPDLNIVKLSYHILTSYGGSGYRWEKTLSYILNTNKDWPEPIDTVEVNVHFPEDIAKNQILGGTFPTGYEAKGKEITWRFSSFTATPQSNIHLDIIDFKDYADMLKYEQVLTATHADNATKLKAAKFFATLAPYKGINISVPTYFKRSYYDKVVLPSLTAAERTLFDSTYELHKRQGFDDSYSVNNYRRFSGNNSQQRTILEVMNRIGYFEKIQYPLIYKYIEGAKKLFSEVVSKEPKNAAAWRAYIDNYYLIETGGCSPCILWAGARVCPEPQRKLIQEAFKHCGNDSEIGLWNRYIFPETAPLPDTIELDHPEKQGENVSIKINHEDRSWSYCHLSPDELNLFKEAYTISIKGFLILRNPNVDGDTKKKLVAVLDRCFYFRGKFCHDLHKLQNPEK
jgi:hypothetical protein